MTARNAYLTASLTLAIATALTGTLPLATLNAQRPTAKSVGILLPQDFPPSDGNEIFSTRLATEQAFVAMPGHPQTYRLELRGRPLRQLSIGAQFAYGGSGLHRDLYTQLELGTIVPIARHWQLSGGIAGGFNLRHYRLSDIVSEHPAYHEILVEHNTNFSIGAHIGAHYGFEDAGYLAFGTQACVTADGKDAATVSYLRYRSFDNGVRTAVFSPYLVHRFYSRERTKHYYKAGLKTTLFRGRFSMEIAYEASARTQAFAAGIGFMPCQGLALSYDLSLPFRFDGRHAGTAAHTATLSYTLRRKDLHQPRNAEAR